MLQRFVAEHNDRHGTGDAVPARKEEVAKDIAKMMKGFHGDVCKGKSNLGEKDVVEAGAQFRSI